MNFAYLNNEIRFVNSNVTQTPKKQEDESDKMWLWRWLHNRKKVTQSTPVQRICPKCNILLPLNGVCDQCN